MAARNALCNFYGLQTNRLPFKYGKAGRDIKIDLTRVNHSIEEYKLLAEQGKNSLLSHEQSEKEKILARFLKTSEGPLIEKPYVRGPIDNQLLVTRRKK